MCACPTFALEPCTDPSDIESMNADTHQLSSLLFAVDEVLDAPGLLSFMPIRGANDSAYGLVVTVKSHEAAQSAGYSGVVDAAADLFSRLAASQLCAHRLGGDTVEIRAQGEAGEISAGRHAAA